jgi:hypothetical protein
MANINHIMILGNLLFNNFVIFIIPWQLGIICNYVDGKKDGEYKQY